MFKRIIRNDGLIIALLRPTFIVIYFLTEGFFLYQWDDQEAYFALGKALSRFTLIETAFTLGFPAFLAPFIRIFHAQDYTQLILPFSIFNAFVLGTINIYLLFRITEHITKNRMMARAAALLYAAYPFLPFLIAIDRNGGLRMPISIGDVVGWNMTSDHFGAVFLLLGVWLFWQAINRQTSLFWPGLVVGYIGLIRMANLMIFLPLAYVAWQQQRTIRDQVMFLCGIFCMSMLQLAYNWYFFGDPFTTGYQALGHLPHFWMAEPVAQQLSTIVTDHFLLIAVFLFALLMRPNALTGVFVISWAGLFAGYYAGYEQFYNDPIRFLVPMVPALCIGISQLISVGQTWQERLFFFGSLLLLVIATPSSWFFIPFEQVPKMLILLCTLLVFGGLYVKIPLVTVLSLYLYSGIYLLLSKQHLGYTIFLVFACFLLNVFSQTWNRQEMTRWLLKLRLSQPYLLVCIGCVLSLSGWTLFHKGSAGLQGMYYTNMDWEGDPALSTLDPLPNIDNEYQDQNYQSVKWTGWIVIAKAGNYAFSCFAEGKAALWINASRILEIDSPQKIDREAESIELEKGVYPIEIRYARSGGIRKMEVFWRLPVSSRHFISLEHRIPSDVLFSSYPQRLDRFFRKTASIFSDSLWIVWGGILGGGCYVFIHRFRLRYYAAYLVNRLTDWCAAQGMAILRFRLYCRYIGMVLAILIISSLAVLCLQHTWGLQGAYYDNMRWQGEPIVSKVDRIPYLRGDMGYRLVSQSKYSVHWRGWIVITQTGTYRFTTDSDDGSSLWIDDQKIVNNEGFHGLKKVSGETVLTKGAHRIEIFYVQGGGFSVMKTLWMPPHETEHSIPASVLYPSYPTILLRIIRAGTVIMTPILKIAWGGIFLFISIVIFSWLREHIQTYDSSYQVK